MGCRQRPWGSRTHAHGLNGLALTMSTTQVYTVLRTHACAVMTHAWLLLWGHSGPQPKGGCYT